MLDRIARCLLAAAAAAALAPACSPTECDYDLEGKPVNCHDEPVMPGGPLPTHASITLTPPAVDEFPTSITTTQVAVGGEAAFEYTANEVSGQVLKGVGAPFEIITSDSTAGNLVLTADAAGSATLLVTDPTDGSDVGASEAISAVPFAALGFDISRYTAQLGATAAAVYGDYAGILVRLRGPNGEPLVDTSLAPPDGALPALWDLFYIGGKTGTNTYDLTAGSFGARTLSVEFVDHLDSIQFTVSTSGVPAGYRLVCAYGVTDGVEVAASFDMFAQSPTDADEGGESNCMIVDYADGYTTVTASIPSGATATKQL